MSGAATAGLPPALAPACTELAQWIAGLPGPVRSIGVSGAQGSGKTTLCAGLAEALRERHHLRPAVVSLDDFYLGRAAREHLAATVHPLLRTRGVPGTHDVPLGKFVLDALLARHSAAGLRLPRFDKIRDDRLPEPGPPLPAAVDVVLLEGWCVGLPPQAPSELEPPINELEAGEDADGRWRRYVNERLAGEYRDWFGRLQHLIFLQVPDWDSVRRWRGEQEAGNAARAGRAGMNAAALQRFLAHYQRLTAHALRVLPKRADWVLGLDRSHRPLALRPGGLSRR